jgi:hypothetical protein
MVIGDLCEIKVNFEDADFWLVRKGTETSVGLPTKEFSPEHIGVKVTAVDVLIPDYLFYVFMNMQMNGIFKRLCNGTTNLKNIRVKDITSIPVS